ncbi:hypothetical protein NDU88_004598 [Pleurodeles waltl]|uniref:Uncharacterized protein n=1 Tax=Pleurodeles waltl TaxID=8319 RepID=A0AAV7QCH5_PLEWA|nr:hypothetical protein NDU88_004598 [Pleurodeles waltl]
MLRCRSGVRPAAVVGFRPATSEAGRLTSRRKEDYKWKGSTLYTNLRYISWLLGNAVHEQRFGSSVTKLVAVARQWERLYECLSVFMLHSCWATRKTRKTSERHKSHVSCWAMERTLQATFRFMVPSDFWSQLAWQENHFTDQKDDDEPDELIALVEIDVRNVKEG